ncbi:malate dehydrogenase [Candidatus Velamenicoccus archaeovorus]|uniref:Malate dehydrogenase n=1 Tax=Velamenicoccus archaeovorus TaxID=1930593 RepID=A0A410P3S1_VELA1|nr:malate dehydrogenase [Candidatus Velamenicoccus archaeovorus]QAT16819.1 malate dehydrogenase [Candidatus Velamenicoccus archaeovorus]
MKKVAIIGGGFVGGTAAMRIAESGLAQVVLVDVVENVARAKAYDVEDGRYALGVDVRIEGTSDMKALAEADIVVVTAGLPRKPGMTREDLLLKNADIMKTVCRGISQHAAGSLVIVVSNPLDVMTYLAYKLTGFSRQRVFGMGVNLDSSRFANLIAGKLFVGIDSVHAMVIGSHGETMMPLARFATVRGKPLSELLTAAEIEEIVARTKKRGAEIVSLYGSGSAYFAPSAAIFEIVRTVLSGTSKEISASICLEGEYGLRDVAIGVPALIGPEGVERILALDLNEAESKSLADSADAIKSSIKLLKV